MRILSILMIFAMLFSLAACKKTNNTANKVEQKIEKTEPVAASEKTENKDVVVHIESEEQYNQMLKENQFVVADFYADWCPPCKKLAPHVVSLANEFDGKVVFLKINVENFSSLAAKLKIETIPRIFFFKDGKDVEIVKGYMDLDEFRNKVNAMIK